MFYRQGRCYAALPRSPDEAILRFVEKLAQAGVLLRIPCRNTCRYRLPPDEPEA
jgi:hypothetical protein